MSESPTFTADAPVAAPDAVDPVSDATPGVEGAVQAPVAPAYDVGDLAERVRGVPDALAADVRRSAAEMLRRYGPNDPLPPGATVTRGPNGRREVHLPAPSPEQWEAARTAQSAEHAISTELARIADPPTGRFGDEANPLRESVRAVVASDAAEREAARLEGIVASENSPVGEWRRAQRDAPAARAAAVAAWQAVEAGGHHTALENALSLIAAQRTEPSWQPETPAAARTTGRW